MSALKIVKQNIILLIPLGLAFLWTKNAILANTSLQLTAFCVIVFFLLQVLSKKITRLSKNKASLDFLLLTLVIYLVIFSTGGLLSPVFFLNYFLLFAVSLLFEPSAALSLTTMSSFFFILNPRVELLTELLQLGSLFLITPLALIFGSQYIKLSQEKEKVETLSYEGKKLEEEVIWQEKEVKKWTENELSLKLSEIQRGLKSILANPQTSPSDREKLKSIFDKTYQLFQSGRKMEEKIEK